MSAPAIARAKFPTTGPSGPALETIVVERLPILDRQPRFAIAPETDDAIDILMSARAGDEPARRLDGVSIGISSRQFGGKSFGLALAIADRRARAPGHDDTVIVATGCVLPNEPGKVGPVDGFAQKALHVLEFALQQPQAPIFAFPAVNWDAAPDEIKEPLQSAARDRKLTLCPCTTVEDASICWTASPAPRRRFAIMAASAVTLIAILGGWGYSLHAARAPLRECEAGVEAFGGSAGASGIAATVRACMAATASAPDDGRPHFLLGQAHAMNGSQPLASRAWHRAAQLGDIDGMAAYGRYLWLSDTGSAEAAKRALSWLERAGEAGSAAAAEDAGFIYFEGEAIPRDEVAAQRWMARAKALRRRKQGG